MKFFAAYYTTIYGLAARETANVSSNIWNRVILPSEIFRIRANGDSIIFPVALTLEARSPKITALPSSAKIPWMSKRTYPLLWATPQERNLHRMADHCEEANGREAQSHQG